MRLRLPALRRHRVNVASYLALAVVAGSLTAYAVEAQGYPVHQARLHDGGIWATNERVGYFGRLNKGVNELDGGFFRPGALQSSYSLDVVQDGAAVVVRDLADGTLVPVDGTRAAPVEGQSLNVPSTDQVALAGGSLAVLDPVSGKLWASPVDPDTGIDSLSSVDPATAPLARVGGRAALAVAETGTVFAASSATGKLTTLQPADGAFAQPVRHDLGPRVSGQLSLTAVGDRPVVLDQAAHRLVLPDGTATPVARDAVLQQSGPATGRVLVATSDELLAVSLEGGTVTRLSTGSGGQPARPVRVGACAFAAWAGNPVQVVTACDGSPVRVAQAYGAGSDLVFRVNHGQVILNDRATGAIWNVDDAPTKIDDWDALVPPQKKDDRADKKKQDRRQGGRSQPPKAVDDNLGARPGRTTVLHVLDNDSASAGSILAIGDVGKPSLPGAQAVTSPDGQTVQLTLPQGAGGRVTFDYEVNDGKNKRGSRATVRVDVRSDGENGPPALREHFRPPSWSVPAGGTVELPVLGDWRDPHDGDPVVLVSAHADAGSASATADGTIRYVAPAKGGPQQIDYEVSDGGGKPVSGSVVVNVQAPTDTNAIPARAEPDVARGEVGKPIVIHPLDNDLPGSDPTTDNPALRLAGKVTSPAGTTVATDLQTGTLTVRSTQVGPVFLGYEAGYGNAAFAKGQVRVDVAPASDRPAPPVTAPDSAVLRGGSPAVVDVLANDYDPAGNLLVVQQAVEVGDEGGLEVAIVDGRWLRIRATAPLKRNPVAVRYTVTDGVSGEVTGSVTVTQTPPPKDDVPVTADDHAIVRAGDTVAIPVLDNDSSPSGEPLSLAVDTGKGPAGRLGLLSGEGDAFVSGRLVRFVAPGRVHGQQQAVVQYVATNPAGEQAVGLVHVTIVPPPGPDNPDQDPTPEPIEGRVVSGDTVHLKLPTGVADPDGDSVTVVGIGAAPSLGRVLGYGAGSLTYQAYPNASGTDEFTYVVADTSGLTAEATVRVAVVPPGQPQAPVAVDDVMTAAPGRKVSVDVLANDFMPAGVPVRIRPLPASGTVTLSSDQGPVAVTAGRADGKPATTPYTVSDGTDESTASVVVRSRDGYNNPPVAFDAFALPKPGAAEVTVDVLANDYDPDGPASALRLRAVQTKQVRITGGKVVLPVTGKPQVVPYEVEDGDGGLASAAIYVPATTSGAPYVKPGASLRVPEGRSVTADLADLVVDPAGKPVRFTTLDRLSTSPAGALTADETAKTTLRLTAGKGYVGPAAVTFEVTNGALGDGKADTALLTVPVQVGPETPVLRCPEDTVEVRAGGDAVALPIASWCHVWTADPTDAAALRFSASWSRQPAGVSIAGSGSPTLSLAAAGDARPGSTGRLSITVDGVPGRAATLPVRVVRTAPPTLTPVTVEGVRSGESRTIDLARYVVSRLKDARPTVVSIQRTGGAAATASARGSSVTLRPGQDSNGVIRFRVVVSDVADTARTDRQATGEITLTVLGHPGQPGTPVVGRTVLSKSVSLSWSPAAANGAPVDSYEVSWAGGTQRCPGSPCVVTGLTNGRQYTFQVRAHNVVDWGPVSGRSAVARPDAVPTAVTGLGVSQPRDGRLTLSWQRPVYDGTPVRQYLVTWAGGRRSCPASPCSVTGLDNANQYTFSVTAQNQMGTGAAAQVSGQSAGAPATPGAPTVVPVASADKSRRAVRIDWPDVAPNGPGPTTYTVFRTGGQAKTLCAGTRTSTCTDTVASDGTVYDYQVQAQNAAALSDTPVPHTSGRSGTSSYEAAATPDTPVITSVKPTGQDGTATLTFDVKPSYGRANNVECQASGSPCQLGGASMSFPTGGQNGVTRTLTGLPNGSTVSVTLRACNGSAGDTACSAWSAPGTVSTYGPIRNLQVQASASGTTVSWSMSVDPGGKPATVQISNNHGWSRTYTTGAGPFATNGSDNVGYSTNDTITVTVSDSGRNTLTRSAGATTGQAPPPPSPVLTISQPSGSTWVNLSARGLAPNTNYTVGCWVTSNSSGQGGSSVDNFTIKTDGSGGGSWAAPATCQMSSGQGPYGNVRIGPNVVWSNTIPLN